ncbi:uncharacterized protein LOC126855936 [Cataglyphis hispanica]|uniref:uncharacterized protein LOC126855936 n=1 Tax=Cataglyphis hispanica TaxID=1086592 RepID=UPI0021808604|nr:uncharacterized protein LOC126855936 [Cataglyphis hispanica]
MSRVDCLRLVHTSLRRIKFREKRKEVVDSKSFCRTLTPLVPEDSLVMFFHLGKPGKKIGKSRCEKYSLKSVERVDIVQFGMYMRQCHISHCQLEKHEQLRNCSNF